MNSTKLSNIIYGIVIIWAILAGYFAFTDLQISIAVVNEHSGWANFLQNFGEIPGLLVLYSGAIIFLASFKSVNKIKCYSISLLVFLGSVYLLRHLSVVLYHGYTGNYSFVREYKLYIYLVIILINVLAYILIRNINFSQIVKSYSIISVLLGLYGYLFLVQPIKQFWGRIRFRDLEPLYTNFTAWYMPIGINGNQSFPSGHAAMGWMLLPLLIFAAGKKKWVQFLLLTLITSWAIAVQLSRVVIGAHFASDVLFGGCIIIVVYLLLYKKYVLSDANTFTQQQ